MNCCLSWSLKTAVAAAVGKQRVDWAVDSPGVGTGGDGAHDDCGGVPSCFLLVFQHFTSVTLAALFEKCHFYVFLEVRKKLG